MSKHYTINKNIKLKKGGRIICKMSDHQFADKVKELVNKICDKYSKEYILNTESISKIISLLPRAIRELYREKNYTINKDFKGIKPDWENCDLIGSLRHVKNAPYITIRIGGDWECPICVMCYFDGKEFRCYIPEKGNAYRKDLKLLFGNVHSDYNSNSDKTRYNNEYVLTDDAYAFNMLCKEGTLNKEKDIDKKSGISDHIQYDLNMCILDFESRVEVKNNLKESIMYNKKLRSNNMEMYRSIMESVSRVLYKKLSINENGIDYESNTDYCKFDLTGVDYLYIGDPCYCLNDIAYDNIWEGDYYKNGIITVKNKIVGAVHSTSNGDGTYISDSGIKYSVDSGSLGIFVSSFCKENTNGIIFNDSIFSADEAEYMDEEFVNVIKLDHNDIYNVELIYEDGTFTFNIKNDSGTYNYLEVIYSKDDISDEYDEEDYDDSYDELEDYDESEDYDEHDMY